MRWWTLCRSMHCLSSIHHQATTTVLHPSNAQAAGCQGTYVASYTSGYWLSSTMTSRGLGFAHQTRDAATSCVMTSCRCCCWHRKHVGERNWVGQDRQRLKSASLVRSVAVRRRLCTRNVWRECIQNAWEHRWRYTKIMGPQQMRSTNK